MKTEIQDQENMYSPSSGGAEGEAEARTKRERRRRGRKRWGAMDRDRLFLLRIWDNPKRQETEEEANIYGLWVIKMST